MCILQFRILEDRSLGHKPVSSEKLKKEVEMLSAEIDFRAKIHILRRTKPIKIIVHDNFFHLLVSTTFYMESIVGGLLFEIDWCYKMMGKIK